MKERFTQNGIEYVRNGDYYIPNLALPTEKKYTIGKYGRIHGGYIKKNHPCKYSIMLMRGTWLDYLEKVDRKAKAEVERLVKHFAEKLNVTEEMKAENQMQWVGLMNCIKAQAEEIINHEIIYTRGNF